MIRTFWLSFCDDDRPPGERFLGVCVVDVTDADVAALQPEVAAMFPNARPGADAVAAASRKAWTLGCNPGGQMASCELTRAAASDEIQRLPRGRLLSRAELVALGVVEEF